MMCFRHYHHTRPSRRRAESDESYSSRSPAIMLRVGIPPAKRALELLRIDHCAIPTSKTSTLWPDAMLLRLAKLEAISPQVRRLGVTPGGPAPADPGR